MRLVDEFSPPALSIQNIDDNTAIEQHLSIDLLGFRLLPQPFGPFSGLLAQLPNPGFRAIGQFGMVVILPGSSRLVDGRHLLLTADFVFE